MLKKTLLTGKMAIGSKIFFATLRFAQKAIIQTIKDRVAPPLPIPYPLQRHNPLSFWA
jgi:hypothetical protein